jgi:anti-anti-sigma factor
MSTGLRIQTDQTNSKVVLRLSGIIDAVTIHALEKKIAPLIQEKRQLLIDLAKLTHISSAGLRYFVQITKQLSDLEGFCLFFSPSEEVKQLIDLAGLHLNIVSSEKKAVQFRPVS